MVRTIALLFLLAFCSATAMQAQAPAPKPDPEVKKLHVWVGHWTVEGEYKPGPFGPSGKGSGESTGRMILNGFLFERRTKGKTPAVILSSWISAGTTPTPKASPMPNIGTMGGSFPAL